MAYMLDTNMLSNIVRNPRGSVAKRVQQVGQRRIVLSIFVAGEARTWMAEGASARLRDQFALIVARLPVVPFEEPGDAIYADLRARLEIAGTPIGGNGMWIAAHALALDCTLVTANEREFRGVPGLKVENWIA